MGFTNKEFDRIFGGTIHDIVKKVEFPADEIHIRKPLLGGAALIPPKSKRWFPCNVCGGMILIDTRMSMQWRQCDRCQNVFRFRKTGFESFKYQYDPNVRSDTRRSV